MAARFPLTDSCEACPATISGICVDTSCLLVCQLFSLLLLLLRSGVIDN